MIGAASFTGVLIYICISCGVEEIGVDPDFSIISRYSLELMIGTSLLFRRSIIGCGVPDPAQTPSQAKATRGMPLSVSVGTSAPEESLSGPVTASTLISLL